MNPGELQGPFALATDFESPPAALPKPPPRPSDPVFEQAEPAKERVDLTADPGLAARVAEVFKPYHAIALGHAVATTSTSLSPSMSAPNASKANGRSPTLCRFHW